MTKYLGGYHNVTKLLKMCINSMNAEMAYLKDFLVDMCMKIGFLHEKNIVIHKLSTFCG